ncbi:U2 protein [Subterranean clover stunt virus]|uniref:U2 protein n=1 Tax=Subterranean clover stunt virus TaxID=36772 RepID=A0A411K8D4_SCSV|nr:U2 protein [Subterranean clover stunt virus]QBC74516.1 U2 protein [Subterranean clover stunt virus]
MDYKHKRFAYIEAIKQEQDLFWVLYESFLRNNEEMIGAMCKYHGRRVKAYPKMPRDGPARWVLKMKTVYDIRENECQKCKEEERRLASKPVVNCKDNNLHDLYDYGNYRYQVYYSVNENDK